MKEFSESSQCLATASAIGVIVIITATIIAITSATETVIRSRQLHSVMIRSFQVATPTITMANATTAAVMIIERMMGAASAALCIPTTASIVPSGEYARWRGELGLHDRRRSVRRKDP